MTREESIIFYKTHAKRLFNTSLRIVKDSALAEEIMQDTILKFMNLEPFRLVVGSEQKVNSWLAKTCIRASIDQLRKMKRERLFLDEYANDVETTDDSSGSYETVSLDIIKIRKAIDELNDPYRLVLNLILIEGLDYEEISGITGVHEGTIRTQYSRAKKMLVNLLNESNN
ncbi:MAG: RNA polymerase sigma factor [Bacteroidales bacterium]|nr:RNA polymerase sigma factor [Bacteroidales bacterium]